MDGQTPLKGAWSGHLFRLIFLAFQSYFWKAEAKVVNFSSTGELY